MAIIIVDPKRQVKMVKFHIDDHHAFQVKMNFVDQIQRQSECLRDREVIIGFGQDEAIVGIYPFLSMTEIFMIPQCSHEYPRFTVSVIQNLYYQDYALYRTNSHFNRILLISK